MSSETDFLEEDPESICAVSNLKFTLAHSLQWALHQWMYLCIVVLIFYEEE